MHKLALTLACGRYDRTQPLIDGRVQPDGVDLTFIPLRPGETFWRMLNHGEFDVSEMSLSSYTILRSEGDTRFIAIPVFPSRVFRHSALYVRADSMIERPEDLKGRRVGVGDYQMTAAVWVRGFLMHEYGVAPEDIAWVVGKPIRSIEPPAGAHATRHHAGADARAGRDRRARLGDDPGRAWHDRSASISGFAPGRDRLLPKDPHLSDHAYARAQDQPLRAQALARRELLSRLLPRARYRLSVDL